MPLFSTRLSKRRTVWVTLLAWAMALLAGMANACLVQPHGPGTSTAAAAPHEPSAPHALKAMQTAHADHGHPAGHAEPVGGVPDAGKAACLKFCDDERATLAKGGAVQPDLPGPALLARIEWPAMLPTDAVPMGRSEQRPRSQGPPLVIRFLRLTL